MPAALLPVAMIIEGPFATDEGRVVFIVEVGEHRIPISSSPSGTGFPSDEPLEIINPAMKKVMEYVRENEPQLAVMYRRAAALRRAAGKPSVVAITRSPDVRIVGEPERRLNGVFVTTDNGRAEIRVYVGQKGGLIDDCDTWETVSEYDREAAITAALEWVLCDKPRATALGLDADLLEELWR